MPFYYWYKYLLIEKGGNKGFSNKCVSLKDTKKFIIILIRNFITMERFDEGLFW